MRIQVVALAFVIAVGCKKDDSAGKPAQPTPTTPAAVANGPRTIEIEASKDGYTPNRIAGKPGEKLRLMFTRVASGGECLAQLKTPDGKLIELPLGKPTPIEVTVPQEGEVKFACGMDMFSGVIVADKA